MLQALASDEQLAAQVRGGSVRAFEVLFERHHAPVLAFCQHMLGSRDEAEDAVQQTFIAAYRDFARGSEPRSPRAWLYGIARRRCLAALAERRAQPDAGEAEMASDHFASGIVARSELRAVFVDLAALPQDQREALVLAELGGLPHEEIAELLGCPREKVKALVFQARTALATGRAARDTPCAEVREQLETLRGAALRRRVLRRHLRDCAGCRDFRDRVARRRPALGLLLPLAPVVAPKRAIMSAVFGGGGGGALAGGSLGLSGVAATALVAISIPAGVVAAKTLAGDDARPPATTGSWPAAGGLARVAPAPAASRGRAHASPVLSSAPASVPAPRPTARGEAVPDHAGTPLPAGTPHPAGTSLATAGPPPGELPAGHDSPDASAQDVAPGPRRAARPREAGVWGRPVARSTGSPEKAVGNSSRPTSRRGRRSRRPAAIVPGRRPSRPGDRVASRPPTRPRTAARHLRARRRPARTIPSRWVQRLQPERGLAGARAAGAFPRGRPDRSGGWDRYRCAISADAAYPIESVGRALRLLTLVAERGA